MPHLSPMEWLMNLWTLWIALSLITINSWTKTHLTSKKMI